ncbi:hypothetical protein [Streptomyces sp. NPDC001315]|uniref:hypothetical protein n=1 Tax=Streptomyces sp. NPDC001315 TaxID=3364562 RepID=UPI00368BB178
MTTPQQQDPTADQFLMGGGGAPTAKFPSIGASISGRITEKPVVEQQRDIKDGSLKFWKDGGKMMQLVVTVQTDQRDPSIEEDDGRRRIFVKGAMKNSIADAVRAVGARGLEVGGILTVTYTHDGQKTNPAFDPPKQYSAQYIAAAVAELNTPDPTPQQQYMPQAPAPQQYAQPAPAPVPQIPGLTAEQIQAAMANPATAALLQQQQAAAAAGHAPAPAAPADVPQF